MGIICNILQRTIQDSIKHSFKLMGYYKSMDWENRTGSCNIIDVRVETKALTELYNEVSSREKFSHSFLAQLSLEGLFNEAAGKIMEGAEPGPLGDKPCRGAETHHVVAAAAFPLTEMDHSIKSPPDTQWMDDLLQSIEELESMIEDPVVRQEVFRVDMPEAIPPASDLQPLQSVNAWPAPKF